MCDRCGRGVAGGAGPHVLQRETGRKVSAGKGPARSWAFCWPVGSIWLLGAPAPYPTLESAANHSQACTACTKHPIAQPKDVVSAGRDCLGLSASPTTSWQRVALSQ